MTYTEALKKVQNFVEAEILSAEKMGEEAPNTLLYFKTGLNRKIDKIIEESK